MCATQQTQMQTEDLELQLSTAAVGVGSTGTEPSLENMLNQVLLMERRGLQTP